MILQGRNTMKGHSIKRMITLFLCTVMALSIAYISVFAEETAFVANASEHTGTETDGVDPEPVLTEDAEETSETYASEDDGRSNDELLNGYVEKLFNSIGSHQRNLKNSRNAGYSAGANLTGTDAILYGLMRDRILAIAEGRETSTVIQFDGVSAFGLKTGPWTAKDLGVSSIMSNGAVTNEVRAALQKKYQFPSISLAMDALLADYPYELYWYNKSGTGGVRSSNSYSISANSSSVSVSKLKYSISMSVANAYQDGDSYTVNTEKVKAAQNAVSNIQTILDETANLDAWQKVTRFKEYICNLVSYNKNAANGATNTPYGDPWQLVWVFDGDTSTNVVCEGYSKAFKYLCDKSGVDCLLVSGIMSGGTGAGNHMWNLVILDGRSYLVDVTNSDERTVGSDGSLFMATREKGSAWDRYTVSGVTYAYDDDTKATFSQDVLTVFAPGTVQTGTCGDNLTWTLDDEGVLTISGTGKMDDYDSTYNSDMGSYVTTASWGSAPKQVVIKNGVTSIGQFAFYNCSSLTNVTIPNSVTSIGDNAFSYCRSLPDATIPDGLISIGSYSFDNCSSLTSVTIPSSVTSIGHHAFEGCSNLTSINVASANNDYCSDNGVLYNKAKTELLRLPGGFQGAFSIPSGVTSIGYDAFSMCEGLTSVTIPDTVISIYDNAFDGCNSLTNVMIPSSVTSIGDRAFDDCSSLKTVLYTGTEAQWNRIPKGSNNSYLLNAEITYNHHMPVLTAHATVEATCTDPGTEAYWSCNICGKLYADAEAALEIEAPIGIPSLGHDWDEPVYTWNDDNTRVHASHTCKRDPAHTESDDADASKRIIFPGETVAGEINYQSEPFTNPAFSAQSKKTVILSLQSMHTLRLPASLLAIEDEAFYGGAFQAVVIPNSCTSIGHGAFANCKNLLYVRIPASVQTIEDDAFEGSDQVMIERVGK